MCVICEGAEKIERTMDLSKDRNLVTTIRYDEEGHDLLLVRVQLGSFGYTLPIQAKYCFHCGERIKGERK